MTKLSERAMLATLHISAWSGMAIDQEVTDATNEDFKAAKDAGRYNKRLVATKFLQGISSAHSNARKVHRLLTLPWEDDGTRVLATAGYITYTSKMKECRLKAEAEVKLLKGERDNIIRDGKIRLGDMFNPDDYPDIDEMIDKFDFDVEIKNMPDSGDFRAQLSDEHTKAIVKDIERRSNQRLEKAMNDIFLRVEDAVQKMSEKLRDYQPAKDGKKADGVIRDSLVYNINELADFLPLLNVTNDPRITQLQAQLRSELVEHSPEILRADAKVRAQTISKADKILKKVQSYMK
jgi:hypothetical protein